MLAVALGFLSLILLSAPPARVGLTFQAIFALGSFVAAIGLVARIWDRQILAVAMGMILITLGFASVLTMTILPVPALEPYLQTTGAWTNEPIPLKEGWSDFAMALSDMICGLALILAGSHRTVVAFISVTTVRACLWCGAFWQLAYVMLRGELSRLVDSPDGFEVQVGLTVALVVVIPFLCRGDRGWLRTFFGATPQYPLSRLILPFALYPVIAAYLISFDSNLDGRSGAVLTLLNVETVAVCLVVTAVAALRIQWSRRHIRDGISDALQSAPAIIMSQDGIIAYWPRACAEIFGFTADEVIGRHAPTLLRTEYPLPYEQIVDVMDAKGVWSGEVTQFTSDGRKLRVFLRLAFHTFEKDRELSVVATLTDITDLAGV